MKILIVHHCDSWGGAGVSLKDCCEMLLNKHQVTVCLPYANSEVAKQLKELREVSIVSLEQKIGMVSAYSGGPKLFSRTFLKNYLDVFKCRKTLEKILIDGGYNLVILNSITLSWISKLTYNNNVPCICYIRETKAPHVGFYFARSYINKYCQGVLYISNNDMETMGISCTKQRVVKDCIKIDKYVIKKKNNSIFEKYHLKSNMFYIIFCGGTDSLKGYEVIVNAMEKLINYPDIRLLVVGSCDKDKVVQRDNIIHIGRIINMSEIFSIGDILVFPSTSPHQARPVFEAGAFRLPVIISDYKETREEVRNNVNGLLFEPLNSVDLAEKIIVLYKNEKLRIELGENNFRNAEQYHSFNNCSSVLNSFVKFVGEDKC